MRNYTIRVGPMEAFEIDVEAESEEEAYEIADLKLVDLSHDMQIVKVEDMS